MVINGSDELRNISALSLKADFKSDGPCRDVPNHGSHPARYRRHVAREYVLGHPMLVTLADRGAHVANAPAVAHSGLRVVAASIDRASETRSNNELELHEVHGVVQDRYVHPCNHRRGVRCQLK
jgi:hypothetical protein